LTNGKKKFLEKDEIISAIVARSNKPIKEED